MNHQERLYKALKSECEAKINEALLTLDMCFFKGTAIGEHTSEHFLAEALKALDKLISASTKDSKVELSKEQFTMIEMGISDFEKGNVISQSELFEQEREWLRKK